MLNLKGWFLQWRGQDATIINKNVIVSAERIHAHMEMKNINNVDMDTIQKGLSDPRSQECYGEGIKDAIGRHSIGALVYCRYEVEAALEAMRDFNPPATKKETDALTELSNYLKDILEYPGTNTKVNIAGLFSSAQAFLDIQPKDYADKDLAKSICISLCATLTIMKTALGKLNFVQRGFAAPFINIATLKDKLDKIVNQAKSKLHELNKLTAADNASPAVALPLEQAAAEMEINSAFFAVPASGPKDGINTNLPEEPIVLPRQDNPEVKAPPPEVVLLAEQAPDAEKTILAQLNAKYSATHFGQHNAFPNRIISSMNQTLKDIALLIQVKTNAKNPPLENELSKADTEINTAVTKLSGRDLALKKNLDVASVEQLESVASAYKTVSVALSECQSLSGGIMKKIALLQEIENSKATLNVIIKKKDGTCLAIKNLFNNSAEIIRAAQHLEKDLMAKINELNTELDRDIQAIKEKNIDPKILVILDQLFEKRKEPQGEVVLTSPRNGQELREQIVGPIEVCADFRRRLNDINKRGPVEVRPALFPNSKKQQ